MIVGPGSLSGESVPAHMGIDRENLHLGSDRLMIRTLMDGPIRVIRIKDNSQGVGFSYMY